MGKRNVTKNLCIFLAGVLLVIILCMCSGCFIQVEAPSYESPVPITSAPALNLEESLPPIHTEPTEPMEAPTDIPAETTPTVKPQVIIQQTVVVEPPEPKVEYYDVPLSEDLQDHIFKLCEEYDIDPALVIAVIKRESNYKASVKGDNGKSLGLMQIQPRWHKKRMEKLNCPNLLDPYQNVTVGVDILAELFNRGKPVEWVLMAYNGGAAYANQNWRAGTISAYARKVLDIRDNLEFKD